MKKINYKSKNKMLIKYDKIEPFYNVCKVTGVREEINVTIEYIPDKSLLEIQSYRDFFKNDFNLYIEEFAEVVFEKIWKTIKPKYLKVILYLDEKELTPWNVTIERGIK